MSTPNARTRRHGRAVALVVIVGVGLGAVGVGVPASAAPSRASAARTLSLDPVAARITTLQGRAPKRRPKATPTPTPTATATPTPTATATPTPTPTATATPTPTATPSPTTPPPVDPTLAATPLTPFSATGFFRQPITGTALDPRSARIVAALAAAPAYADLYEFGIPVFTATPGTPLSTVRCTEPWGTCAPSTTPVPIPANAVPSSGSDGAMVVVDPVSRKVYEFWQARRTSATTWTTSWGAVNNLDSNGNEGGGAVGAGISLLGGLVRTHEVAAGVINHPLVFSSSLACAGEFRYPATKTDGASTDPGCIPEGARVRLDPSINVDAIAGITPGEKAVAKALQKYGAFCRDRGGARLAIIFEDPAGKPDPYPAAGLAWDYYAMQRIPWGSLQVMAN